MLQQKVRVLYALLLISNVSLWAMDQPVQSLVTKLKQDLAVFYWGVRDPLDEIRSRVGFASLDQSLDQMLWQLRNGADPYKKDIHGTSFVDCLNHKKFARSYHSLERHILFSYLEPTSEIVWRSGCYRQTYPQGLKVKQEPPVVCTCLGQESSAKADEDAALSECVLSKAELLPDVPQVLTCDALQSHSHYAFLKNIVASAETASDEIKKPLWQQWKKLLADWRTYRICATLPDSATTDLFQFALLQDDYDLVSYMLQHKMVTRESISRARENTFFARSVPMLELLEQYGVLSLMDDQQNTPFHHVAKHGRLMLAPVIDFYVRKGVDPLAANRDRLTPLALLVQYSFRFSGHEPKLQKFIDMLLKQGACGREVHPRFGTSILEVAQAVHKVWNVPSTAQVLEKLHKQEILDQRYAQFLKFRKAFAIMYPRVEGDTPLHTVVKMMLQKHDRLTEFVPSFKEMGYQERLAFFQNEFDTVEALLKQGYDFAAQNSQGKTIFHELCADWHNGAKQRDILYRQLLRLIFTSQTELATYHREEKQLVLEDQSDIRLMSERCHRVLSFKDNQGVSVLDMVCNESKPCTHEGYWCVGSLLLGTTPTFKNRLITFLRHDQAVKVHEDYKWVLGLYECTKKE